MSPAPNADENRRSSAQRRDAGRWLADTLASLVVFLVALPLCIGIAVACGVPAERGLISGVVGGLVVATLAGSPLLVTGPAASLIVPVFDLVQHHGLAALGPVVILAGVWQVLAGVFGLGQWFRAVAPAVIIGMLVGIGLVILASQLHVAVDSDPRSTLVRNLTSFPAVVASRSTTPALGVGLATIALLVGWNRMRPRRLKLVPGHLVSLVVVSVATYVFDFQVRFLDISPNFLEALSPVHTVDFEPLLQPQLLGTSLMFAFVASAATLLTASAIDQRQSHASTNYNREMVAQGVGNMVTGGVGGLPMTGVIVRSSVNVDAGARTRASAILHGTWILGFVLVAPEVLERIPRSALGAILVYTGYKLIDVRAMQALYRRGRSELAIALITLGGVVFVELFVGVLAGLGAALIKLVYTFSHLEIRSEASPTEKVQHLHLAGSATFVRLPQLAEALDDLPGDRRIVVHIDRLDHIDHACLELLSNLKQRREAKGEQEVIVEWDELTHRYENAVLGVGLRPSGPSGSLLSLVWAEWKRAYGFSSRSDHALTQPELDAAHVEVRRPYTSLQQVVDAAARMLSEETGVGAEQLSARLSERADQHIVLGQGISIPHAPLQGIDRSHAVCIVTERPVPMFGEYADVFFVLIAPEADPEKHLQALARVGALCHDADLLQGLRTAQSPEDAVLLLREAEQRPDHVAGSGDRERRLVVLELDSGEGAEHVREIAAAASRTDVAMLDGDAPSFEALRHMIGAPANRYLLVQSLTASDLSVLRALLEEQSNLFPERFCRLHVLAPESRRRESRPETSRVG